MGMMRSGTTLLAEMVHKGGIPMYDVAANPDPSYDKGIRYERPLAHEIDHEILGLTRNTIGLKIAEVGIPEVKDLKSICSESMQKLSVEVGEAPWGFKNPRTTLTYPIWRQTFLGGATFYVYRCHEEVLHYHFKSRSNPLRRLKRMRMGARAWVLFNERMLENIELDKAQNRPYALVRYEQLMDDPKLIKAMENATGIPLFDARDPKLRRHKKAQNQNQFFYKYATRGFGERIANIYTKLDALALKS